jgi:hypothetical protein
MVILWPDIESGRDLVSSSLDGFGDHLTLNLDGLGDHLDSVLDGCLSHLDLILDGLMPSNIESETFGEPDSIH